jgi:hypothetical protein
LLTSLVPPLLRFRRSRQNLRLGFVGIDPETAQEEGFRLFQELGKPNWPMILGFFPIFFLGGYFIYSSLVVGNGSAIATTTAKAKRWCCP